MNDEKLLYNSRIIKVHLEYIKRYYPDKSIDQILEYAGINRYEVNDSTCWFTQVQVDRFHEIMLLSTGNLDIARGAGRFTIPSGAAGVLQQYTLGLLSLGTVYMLLGKVYTAMSRGADVKTKKIKSNKVEVISTPRPGVNEKPYQCDNRLGTFESLAKLFTNKFAEIEHPECFHRGGKCCRYIISWDKTPSTLLKRVRNFAILTGIIGFIPSFFILSVKPWLYFFTSYSFIILIFSLYVENVAKRELSKTVETQGDAARVLIEEMNTRNNNALLIQEIGQATSSILNLEKLLKTVMRITERRLDFDRGLIMFANKTEDRLRFSCGYGYTEDEKTLLRETEFHLDRADSKGIFVLSYKKRKPFLVNDISENGKNFSERSLSLAKKLNVRSLISIPIIYEKKSLGIFAVDNVKSKRSLTQIDINILMGVASHTAISIMNARAFQRLHESEKNYRQLVENANSIIMSCDISGKIIFFNEFAQKLFGYTEDEIIGKSVKDTILRGSKETYRNIAELISSLKLNPDIPYASEFIIKLNNNEKAYIAWTFKPEFNEEGRFTELLCIGNDITEIKKAEEEKNSLEKKLQRSQKMEAIGTLAGGVAHDLNNILSGIVSYPELLLLDIPEDDPLRKPMLTIQKSGERAAAIVQDLLTMARRGVVAMEAVNINDVITEYLQGPEHEKLKEYYAWLEVETDFEPNLLNISGSPVHLSKIVMNLLYNAAEAMPDGGRIFLSTKNQYIDSYVRGYDDVKEGDYVIFEISDTGTGISQEVMDRIFEPFYTNKIMGRSGTGLGMAVVWGTVKDHNGYIDIKSTQGSGSTFTLFFPVTRQEKIAHRIQLTLEDYKGRGENILVVDDVKEQREIASVMLDKLGYNVATVSSGEEAVEYLKKKEADLIVLDMIMGAGMDGLDTYKKIIGIKPEQKVIIASGFSETGRIKEAQRLGAGAYLKKPYMIEKIGLAIRNQLDGNG